MKSLDWPNPSVLSGSVRTMIGKSNDPAFNPDTISLLKDIAVSGPFALYEGQLFFRSPRDIAVRKFDDGKTQVYSIRPKELNKGEGVNMPDESILPAMILDKGEGEDFKPSVIAPLWSYDLMTEWLADPDCNSFIVPDITDSKGTKVLNLPEKDPRVHVGINPEKGLSDEGMLFETIGLDFSIKGNSRGIQVAARLDDQGEYSEFVSNINSYHPFGGKRRLSHWKTVSEQKGWKCPEKVLSKLSKNTGLRMVLATPAIFSGGWLPGWLKKNKGFYEGSPPGSPENICIRLVGACIERWNPLSGWSLEKVGPKPLRRMVSAGSVYFFEVISGEPANLAKTLWLQPVSDIGEDKGQNLLDGFGSALWGAWDFGKKANLVD